ncbi:hypothetical protein M9Y10_044516 [Tritrichomonas musculus]|uniref:Polymorphic outer membrane protein n=1 Tax=Tritrichomonas musculus TaxID=1915356 RepID=A0ABR2JSJ7_9EUKA
MSDSYFFGFSNDNLYQQNEIKCQSNCISPNKKYIYSIDHFSSGFSNEECIVTPPINPTEAPINPTEAPINPTNKPVGPSVCPSKPSGPVDDLSSNPTSYTNKSVIYGCNLEISSKIISDQHIVHLYQCTFNGLQDESSEGGGAIYIMTTSKGPTNKTCIIEDCTFSNCQSTKGGALSIVTAQPTRFFSILRSKFNNNKAIGEGGAIYFHAVYSTIDSCEFTNNQAGSGNGSEIYFLCKESEGGISTNPFLIQNSKFEVNEADTSSNMIYLDWIKSSDFEFKKNEVRITSTNNNYLFSSKGDLNTGRMTIESNCISDKSRLCESNNIALHDKITPGFPTICGSILPPTEGPINPTETPNNPTEAPINPTEGPINPTYTPNNPTEAPINPTYTPNNPTEAPINPTEISNTPIISGPIDDELTVDQTINFTGDSVEFNKNGYKVDEKDISVTDKKAEIILINPMKGLSLIKINTTTEKPEKAVFVSPTTKNTDAIILTPTDGSNDYGQGEIGIHANSNLNNIILQTEKVPLNIYSNEASDVSFKLEKSTNESTIYLNHLIMNDGSLQMKVPDEVETIQFIVVEVYKLDKIEALRSNKEQIETRIDELRLRSGSHLTLASTNIRKVIKASPRSKLSIEGSAAFNNETKIEMTETSFINFGSSNVEGIISEIKLSENGTDVNHLQEDESIIPLICGDNFKCSDWKDNFVGNIKYIAAKCISYNNQECLAATNKPVVVDKHSGNKSLPTGAIIAIVVVVVVVIAAILIVIILVKKKSNYNYNHFNDDAFQGEIEGDNRSVESFGENSLNNSSLTEEFDNILYNSADQHHSSSDDPFMKEFEDNSA